MNENNMSHAQKAVAGTIWVLGEKILAQLASFIVSLFLSRLLFPDEYGVVAIALIFITISTVFVDCGLGTALVQKKHVRPIDYSTAFVCSLSLSIILYLFLFFMAKPIAVFFGTQYNTDTITNIIRLMAIKLPLGAYLSIQNAYIQKNFLFKKAFWGSLIGTVLSGVFGVISAYKGLGAYSLVVQSLSDNIIDIILISISIKWFSGLKVSFNIFKGLFNYGSKIFAATLIDRCYNSLTSFVIGKKYTAGDLALYNKGEQMPHLICTNIEGSIEKALFPTMAELQDNKGALKNGIRESIKLSSYFIFPMLIGLMCVGDALMVFLFTEKWKG